MQDTKSSAERTWFRLWSIWFCIARRKGWE